MEKIKTLEIIRELRIEMLKREANEAIQLLKDEVAKCYPGNIGYAIEWYGAEAMESEFILKHIEWIENEIWKFDRLVIDINELIESFECKADDLSDRAYYQSSANYHREARHLAEYSADFKIAKEMRQAVKSIRKEINEG